VTEKQRKFLSTFLKICISVLLLYFIFTKVDFKEVIRVLKLANPLWLIVAILLFIVSKVLNALRLNLYFHAIGVPLTQLSNLKLYALGMFYNLFLPGGIGGDAYKGYVIKKKYEVGTKRIVGVLLLDRLSGMLLILVYTCILGVWINIPLFTGFNWLFLVVIPLGIYLFWVINRHLFPYALSVFWGSFGYSALLQVIQLAATVCIVQALGLSESQWPYLFIFLISSIVSVVPLTIGGIGSREITFLYGAQWLGLDSNTAIGISFVFFLITAFVSFFGIAYHIKKPELRQVT